jgi:hypothetical protein
MGRKQLELKDIKPLAKRKRKPEVVRRAYFWLQG